MRAPARGWPTPLRRALGRELLGALEDGEDVAMVTPTSTWASPQALLAVTDRRLLWLLDDAPTHRVRSLRYRDVADVQQRLGRPAAPLGRPARAHDRRAPAELRRAAPRHRGGHRAARGRAA